MSQLEGVILFYINIYSDVCYLIIIMDVDLVNPEYCIYFSRTLNQVTYLMSKDWGCSMLLKGPKVSR